MKKLIALSLILVLLAAFTGCVPTDDPADGDTETSGGETTAADTTAATTAAPSNSAQDGSGTVGDFAITIKSFTLTKDYEDKPAVYVNYDWTNNSDKATAFMYAIDDTVFQNGVECESAILMSVDGFDSGLQMKEIKPGATLTVQAAYVLNDASSPIEIELTELFSFASDPPMVTKTFEIK